MELGDLAGLGGRQHLVGMAVDLHMAPDPDNATVFSNQNCCAKNAEEGPAIHGFFAPDAIGLEYLMLLI